MTAAVTLVLGITFAMTAEWNDSIVNVDAVAAAAPAWSLTQHGILDLSSLPTSNPWIVEGPNGAFSNRPPGLWFTAIPSYLLLGDPEHFSTDPATVTAVVLTALAMGVLYLVLRRLVLPRQAVGSVVIFALGTSTWPISSMQLWPHGPGQLVAGLGILALAAGRNLVAASLFGGAVLIRPPTAVFPSVIGVGALKGGWRTGVRILLPLAASSALAVAALVVYNWAIFDVPTLSGGYSSTFRENLVSMGLDDYVANLLQMFVLPPNGLFFWSPVVLIGAIAAIEQRALIPSWSKVAAVAAVAYLLVHARMNRASGGLPFNYRYPLEPLMLAAPFLTIGAVEWFKAEGWKRIAILGSAALSIALQLVFLFTLTCVPNTPNEVLCSFQVS